jgi:hypothetical protein
MLLPVKLQKKSEEIKQSAMTLKIKKNWLVFRSIYFRENIFTLLLILQHILLLK